jgi:hypothetical protein
MDQKKDETWIANIGALVDSYRSLISIRITEHSSLGISISIMGVMYAIITVFVLLFTGLGSAWWIGERLNNMKAGFFIVGGFYLLLFIILVATSSKIWIPYIRNLIIKKIYEQD